MTAKLCIILLVASVIFVGVGVWATLEGHLSAGPILTAVGCLFGLGFLQLSAGIRDSQRRS